MSDDFCLLCGDSPSFCSTGTLGTKVISSLAAAAFSVIFRTRAPQQVATMASMPARMGISIISEVTLDVSSSRMSCCVNSAWDRTVPGESFMYSRDSASANTFSLPGI